MNIWGCNIHIYRKYICLCSMIETWMWTWGTQWYYCRKSRLLEAAWRLPTEANIRAYMYIFSTNIYLNKSKYICLYLIYWGTYLSIHQYIFTSVIPCIYMHAHCSIMWTEPRIALELVHLLNRLSYSVMSVFQIGCDISSSVMTSSSSKRLRPTKSYGH